MESSCQFYITNCYQTHLLLRLLIWFQLWVANFTTILLQINFCFMSGLWVQCHVLCQKWSWRWWEANSYAACCCTGDTQLCSVWRPSVLHTGPHGQVGGSDRRCVADESRHRPANVDHARRPVAVVRRVVPGRPVGRQGLGIVWYRWSVAVGR